MLSLRRPLHNLPWSKGRRNIECNVTWLLALFVTANNAANSKVSLTILSLHMPVAGFEPRRGAHSGVPAAEPQPCSEAGSCRGSEEPGVQAPVQQDGSPGLRWYS